jgi:hypothetical protein
MAPRVAMQILVIESYERGESWLGLQASVLKAGQNVKAANIQTYWGASREQPSRKLFAEVGEGTA